MLDLDLKQISITVYSQSESISLRELLGLLPCLLFIISVDYYLKKVDYYSNEKSGGV
jgi:hypothetical protein